MKAQASKIQKKGKDGQVLATFNYVTVAQRLKEFHDTFASQSPMIQTEILSDLLSDRVFVKAIVSYKDKDSNERVTYVAHSQAMWSDASNFVNKTSALENAETSAVGRALAMMGIGLLDVVASVDEMDKALNSNANSYQQKPSPYAGSSTGNSTDPNAPSEPQLILIRRLSKELGLIPAQVKNRAEASAEITRLKSLPKPS